MDFAIAVPRSMDVMNLSLRPFQSWSRSFHRAALILMSALCIAPLSAAREVPNFNLLDLSGHNHELQRAGGKAVVLFFTGTGCPIARKSVPKLKALHRRFAPEGVSFWIINSYADDQPGEIQREVHELGLHHAVYLHDAKQGVALALGVQRTAEVVVVETQHWKVLYQGAIDDQLTEGAERPAERKAYLETALTEFLAGQPVTTSQTPARGCRLTFAGGSAAESVPHYGREVAPLLQKHCVACHREGAIGPFALDGHGRVRNQAKMIEEVLLTRRMPPWDPDPHFGHFTGGPGLTREETQTLQRWISAGAPRGDGPDPLAAPLPPLADWELGQPSAVIRLPEVQQIPATGVLDYRKIQVTSPFTNEVWISAIDVKPSNRKVVHHVILYATWPGCPDDGSGNGVHLCGWAPGFKPGRFPEGVGKRLPANATLTVEMHYTTCGSPQTDQTELAFHLLPGPQPRLAETRQAIEMDLDIPPGSDEARHSATYAFQRPGTLYRLMPHMHRRGKWMRFDLMLPDGKQETLLHVPRYDFQWQLGYTLAQPRHVPAGAWLLVTGAFDNSPANPANPDATKRVRFGLQSWDEMFIGFFDAADDPELATGTGRASGGAGAGAGSR